MGTAVRRSLLAISAFALLCGAGDAQNFVSSPGILPSSPLIPGACVQATGPNSVATIVGSCGTGSGSGNVSGPTSSVAGDIAAWNNTTGTLLEDSGLPFADILTTSAAAALYETQANAASTFETIANAAATFMPLSGGTFIGTIVAPEVDINQPAGDFKLLRYETAGAFDFSVGLDQVGNYTLFRHNPANNTVIDTPFAIELSNGLMNISQRPVWSVSGVQATPWDNANLPNPFTTAGGTLTGPLTAPQVNINGPAATFRPVSFNTAGVQRWQIGADNSAESGSNAGSNFSLFAFPDNGANPLLAIAIARSTGQAGFLVRPTFNGAVPWDSANLTNPVSTTNGNVSITGTLTATFGVTTGGVVSGASIDAGSGGVNSSGPVSGGNGSFLALVADSMAIQNSSVGALCNQGGSNGFTTTTSAFCPGTNESFEVPIDYIQTVTSSIAKERIFARQTVCPASLAGAQAWADTEPTSATTLAINQFSLGANETKNIGSISFVPSLHTGNFVPVGSGTATFAPGDLLQIVGPAAPNGLAGVAITFLCTVEH
jgi:hypothetical protein